MFSPSKSSKPFNTVDAGSRQQQNGRYPQEHNTFTRKSDKTPGMRNISSSMNQMGGVRRRKIEDSSGHHRNSRLGKSQAHPLNKQPHNPLTDSRAFLEVDEAEQNFN